MVCGLAVLLVDRRARDGPAAAAAGRAPPAGHPQRPGEHPERARSRCRSSSAPPCCSCGCVATENLERLPRLGSRDRRTDPSRCTRRSGRSRSWLSSSRSWSRRSSPSPTCSTTPRDGEGPGGGGSAYHLTSVNPFIRLRRDLVEKTHTPMVYAETKARSTSYLRTTVLDRFTDDEWRPSPRSPAEQQPRRRHLPEPSGPGSPSDRRPRTPGGSSSRPNFSSTWLPLPYPVRKVDIDGHLALRRTDPRRGLRRRWAAAAS